MMTPPNTTPDTLHERMKLARELAGLTRAQFAKRVGIGQASVNDWESGTTSDIGIRKFAKAAEVLGVSVDWLNKGEGSGPAHNTPSAAKSTDIAEITKMLHLATTDRQAALVELIRWLVIASDDAFFIAKALTKTLVASPSNLNVSAKDVQALLNDYILADDSKRSEAINLLKINQ
jgi:transcriptional regulator with XRE-family HTH domain